MIDLWNIFYFSEFLIEINKICPDKSIEDLYIAIHHQLSQLFINIETINIDNTIEFDGYHNKLKSENTSFIPRTYHLTEEQINFIPLPK